MKSTRVSRKIDAPRDVVYLAFLDATAVATWMFPADATGWIHAFDPSEGGVFRFSLSCEPPAGGRSTPVTDTFHGLFVKLVPRERIVQLLEIETRDPSLGGRMTITISLTDSGEGGTTVVVEHSGLPRGISKAENKAGWESALDRLAGLVEGAVRAA